MSRSYFWIVVSLLAVFSSCKKIQERKIINGTWEVVKVVECARVIPDGGFATLQCPPQV